MNGLEGWGIPGRFGAYIRLSFGGYSVIVKYTTSAP